MNGIFCTVIKRVLPCYDIYSFCLLSIFIDGNTQYFMNYAVRKMTYSLKFGFYNSLLNYIILLYINPVWFWSTFKVFLIVFSNISSTKLQYPLAVFFKKMGQSRSLFVDFCSFLITISIQFEKSIDGVLGIRTRGRRMVGADETTELWWPPILKSCSDILA